MPATSFLPPTGFLPSCFLPTCFDQGPGVYSNTGGNFYVEDTTMSRLSGLTYGACSIMTVGSYGAFDNVKCEDISSVRIGRAPRNTQECLPPPPFWPCMRAAR